MKRSYPYFNTLLKAPENKRMGILQAFPTFVVDDLIEIIYNVVLGNIDIGSKAKSLHVHKRALLKMVNTKSKKMRRGILYKQKGGFIAALLPLALGALGIANFFR